MEKKIAICELDTRFSNCDSRRQCRNFGECKHGVIIGFKNCAYYKIMKFTLEEVSND